MNVATGDVYVVDPGANRVEQFDAGGSFVRAWGWGVATGASSFEECTSGCQAGNAGFGDGEFDGPTGIAIDQSDGSVYVVDGNNSRVEKFDASGAYLGQFGTAGSGDGQLSGPQGIVVDLTDRSVYVADTSDNRVEKFDDTGAYVSQFGVAGSGDGQFSSPTRIAVDSTGQVYVLDAGNSRIERFTSAGAFDSVFGAADVFLPSEIAVGPGNDHLYVAQWAQDFSEQRVVELDATGALVATHGVGSTANSASGLGLNAASARVYLADGGNSRVFIVGDLAAPTATIDSAANVTSDSADLSGSVNPNGPPAVAWHFETSTDSVSWSPLAADQDAGSGTGDVAVAGAMSGLAPNATYFARLVATRPFNAAIASAPIQFTTVAVAPDAETLPANDIAPTHGTFRGLLDAHNASTTYHFEYGKTAAYGSTLPAAGEADAGSQDARVEVVQRIDGLESGTIYHYRIVAHNQAGTTPGQDQEFTTTRAPTPPLARAGIPGAGVLPDDRGWELVSPPEKDGGDIMADSSRTRAARDGGAVSFTSLGGFGDVRGTGVATEYVSVRTGQAGSNGWAAHAITPPQDPLTILAVSQNRDPEYVGDFSADFSQAVFQAWSPVTSDPSVAKVSNLYLRTDVRSAGPGSYQLLTACAACGGASLPAGTAARLAGASDDYTHFVFESNSRLTSDTPACALPPAFAAACPLHVYEWDHGVVRLVDVFPDGTPASSAMVGQGMATNNRYTPHVMSADGSRIFFTDTASATGSFDGNLYLREDHSRTVMINASERTPPDPNPQTATYENASRDGSRVFFTTAERLTDDDTNSVRDLYMYDVNAASGHHLTRLSVRHEFSFGESDVDGVVGVSNDGHFVYFIARLQFVAGAPRVNAGLYLWHDGVVSYVSEIPNAGLETTADLPGSWVLSPLGSRVTPDGRYLLFTSWGGAGKLTGYDQSCAAVGGPCAELYLYDAASGRLSCVSCNPNGAPATSPAEIFIRDRTSAANTNWHVMHAITDDGSKVFFTTKDALVPQDSNGRRDVYEYDVPSGTVHLLSSGKDPVDSYLMDATPNGSDVFFLTRARLVGWDSDQSYDLYDARVGGGLPEPAPAVPACSGDGCKGSPAASLTTVPASSSTFHGAGNKKRTVAHKRAKRSVCRRGFKAKRVRVRGKSRVSCVKLRSHKAKRGVG